MKVWKIVFSWLIVVLVMMVIFMFSSKNGDASGQQSYSLAEPFYHFFKIDQLIGLNNFLFIVRKLAHFSIFCLLGWSVFNALRQTFSLKVSWFGMLLITVGVVFLYACSDEMHQFFVSGRSCELRDVMIDTSGGSFGSLIYYMVLKIPILSERYSGGKIFALDKIPHVVLLSPLVTVRS